MEGPASERLAEGNKRRADGGRLHLFFAVAGTRILIPRFDYCGATILSAPQKERVKALSEARLDRSYSSASLELRTKSPYLSAILVLMLSIGRHTTESEKKGEKS